jgi:hypothetical protein
MGPSLRVSGFGLEEGDVGVVAGACRRMRVWAVAEALLVRLTEGSESGEDGQQREHIPWI